MAKDLFEEAVMDQVYGKVACDTRAAPSRQALERVACRRGWTVAAFDAWARGKRWKHDDHGREASPGGPDAPDCPCRTTPEREECAAAGCGFCRAAVSA